VGAKAIIENGGEVLRFIGDAVLAIFPIAGETSKSRKNATGALEACRWLGISISVTVYT